MNKKWLYIIIFLLSIALIAVYFINSQNAVCILSSSIGTSFLGAVVLTYLFEKMDKEKRQLEIMEFRSEKLGMLKIYLTKMIEILIFKFFVLNLKLLNKNKIYALRYLDVEKILINLYTQREYENTNKKENFNLDKNFYVDGLILMNNISEIVNKIIMQEDLLVLNKVFSKDEIAELKTVINYFPLLNDNLELIMYSTTICIDQLLNIKELSYLKKYYGVYSQGKFVICNENKESVNKPLNIDFNLENAIKNGLDIINIINQMNKDIK